MNMNKTATNKGVESLVEVETMDMNITATNKEYEVEKVIKRRRRGGKYEFLLRWKDFPPSADSWEKEENLNPYLFNMARH
ncbi:hypothetical protein SNE40_021079 [Patella caerulea]|uniref:Chromo domain-containing protein n=1 Tax=Patella caerulea TaxID=87958 RepID=A0AAN8J0Z2_PATCE